MAFLISIIIVLIVVGVLLWIVDTAPVIAADMKRLIHWVVIVIAVLWLLGLLTGYFPPIPLARWR